MQYYTQLYTHLHLQQKLPHSVHDDTHKHMAVFRPVGHDYNIGFSSNQRWNADILRRAQLHNQDEVRWLIAEVERFTQRSPGHKHIFTGIALCRCSGNEFVWMSRARFWNSHVEIARNETMERESWFTCMRHRTFAPIQSYCNCTQLWSRQLPRSACVSPRRLAINNEAPPTLAEYANHRPGDKR